MVCLSKLILLISVVINLFASLIKPLYCNEISYFDILGVKQTSSEDEIKKSYRKLAKLYHPDKNKNDPSAQTKFIEITKAYEVLSDHQKRLEYEDSLRFSNRINSRGDSRVNNWRQRRHQQFPSHLFEEDLFRFTINEIYGNRSPMEIESIVILLFTFSRIQRIIGSSQF
jgi:curved DNA-binding protein CbpA